MLHKSNGKIIKDFTIFSFEEYITQKVGEGCLVVVALPLQNELYTKSADCGRMTSNIVRAI